MLRQKRILRFAFPVGSEKILYSNKRSRVFRCVALFGLHTFFI